MLSPDAASIWHIGEIASVNGIDTTMLDYKQVIIEIRSKDMVTITVMPEKDLIEMRRFCSYV